MKFKSVSWDEVKNKNISLVLPLEERVEFLKKIGYDVDKKGFLINKKTKKQVIAEDGKEINVWVDKEFALISGTHNFVRDLIGYAKFLTKKGLLKILPKE